jgi:hypothetical protein
MLTLFCFWYDFLIIILGCFIYTVEYIFKGPKGAGFFIFFTSVYS